MTGRTYTPLQNDRVLRDILARRLLSGAEIAVCAYVWRFSWGMRGHDRTHPHVKISGIGSICEFCAMPRSRASEAFARLVRDGVLIRHQDASLEFNEHVETWTRGVPKTGRLLSRKPVATPTGIRDTTVPKTGRDCPENRSVPLYRLDTVTDTDKYSTKNPKPKSERPRALDPVWDVFAARYQAEYGEAPIRADRFFVNLARLRKHRSDDKLISRIDDLFNWQPSWMAGRWTFDDLVKHIDKIPTGGGNGKPESETDKCIRRERERKAHLANAKSPDSHRGQLPDDISPPAD